MKTLYLHIGMGKTGTTALQEYFWHNKEQLKNMGIFYPAIGVVAGAHHLLSPHHPVFLQHAFDFMEVDDWAPQVDNCSEDKILISSELIAWAAPEVVESFCTQLKRYFNVNVVLYLRRQDNIIMAGYNQQIKAGTQKKKLDDILKGQLKRFDYKQKIEPWACALGEDNIIIRPYERQQFHSSNILNDFMYYVFGEEIVLNDVVVKNSNPRLSVVAMEFKRIINNFIPDVSESSEFNEALLAYSIIEDQASKEIFSAHNILSHERRRDIIEHCSEVNEQIAKRYLNREDGVLFYDELPEIKVDVMQDHLKECDMTDIVTYLSEQYPCLIDKLNDVLSSCLSINDSEMQKYMKYIADAVTARAQS